ncbi:MAG TPA: sigma-70 family RNA polymerase sigma factor [Terriglobia bacterium]|nr:sigma-70 family RNA polymerase sigma factor [Terriglobia bacterium]
MASSRILTLALDRTLPAFGADRASAIASDEAALVAELQSGSEPAFAYLVAVFESPIYNLVWHILGNEADAADVLQEVFVKVFRGVKQFHGASSLRTWIYRIALHEASNHRRGWLRRHAHEPMSLDEEPGQPGMAVAEAAQSSSQTPYQNLEQAERQARVERALASLAEPYRTVVALREIEDLSYEEIAEVLSVAEGTVKSRLMRGRELLRRKLAAWK